MIYFAIWLLGAIVAYGYRGGIRDEMDGIGDMFFITFWFIVLPSFLIYLFCCGLSDVGKAIKRDVRTFFRGR